MAGARKPARALVCALLIVASSASASGTETARPQAPAWAQPQRMTVLVDSVLYFGVPALREAMPEWNVDWMGRPELRVGQAVSETLAGLDRVAPVVVVGLGYNTDWEKGRRNHRFWAKRFDRDARRLLARLRELGARKVVWVNLREPRRATVPRRSRPELKRYAWWFGYVNERLERLQRRHGFVIADWRGASDRRGLTYDSIHLNPAGAAKMARTIRTAIGDEIRRVTDPAVEAQTPVR